MQKEGNLMEKLKEIMCYVGAFLFGAGLNLCIYIFHLASK